jgi:hypothetical protein
LAGILFGILQNLRPGRNTAMKIPFHQFEETVSSHRNLLQSRQLGSLSESIGFDFDETDLWLDQVETASHAKIWLETVHKDPAIDLVRIGFSATLRSIHHSSTACS